MWLGRSAENIFGPATSVLAKSALSIVRVDGPDAATLFERMTRPTRANPRAKLTARTAALRRVVCPHSLETIDPEAIVIDFPHAGHPSSTFEFHLHGSKAVVKSVISALSTLDGFRLAQPGEFTRRRFERSRTGMDLNQLLGLKNLIDAETDEQRKLAIHQFDVHAVRTWISQSIRYVHQKKLISSLDDGRVVSKRYTRAFVPGYSSLWLSVKQF